MERPQEIIRFATLAVVASLINFAATAMLTDYDMRSLLVSTLGVVLVVGLVLWIAKGRSPIGRVVLTLWLAFATGSSVAGYIYLLAVHRTGVMSPGVQVLSLITVVADIFALYFLWAPPSSAWLQKRTGTS